MYAQEYADHIARLRAVDTELADAFAPFETVEGVLDWMAARNLPPGSVDMVSQDEFHYDFLVHHPDGRWLVFGVN